MARPKCYETVAEKQRAYRNRKKLLSGGVEGHAHSGRDHVSANQSGSIGGETGNPTPSENQASPAQVLRDEDVGAMNCVECGGYEEHRDGCSSMRPKPEDRKQSTLAVLRELVKVEHKKIVEEPVKPLIFRNDYGNVISERAWNQLQEKKRKAKEGEYEIDEYSQ